jgi:5-methylcytosine-specific restriction protein A
MSESRRQISSDSFPSVHAFLLRRPDELTSAPVPSLSSGMPTRPPRHGAYQSKPLRKTAARGYGARWRKLRRLIASERPAVCVACGYAGASRAMHLDHIRPLSQGGTNDPCNLQWLCAGCHSKKTVTRDGGFGR